MAAALRSPSLRGRYKAADAWRMPAEGILWRCRRLLQKSASTAAAAKHMPENKRAGVCMPGEGD